MKDTNKSLEEFELDKYHKPHMGEAGGYCPHCATIDHAKQALTSYGDRRAEEERERCKQIIIRRTEIPTGAKNPTRDAVVLLGEELVELLDETQPKQE